MKRLNLASGQRPYPEPWINIDARKQGEHKVDIIADIRKLDMIEDNSCEILVAHHCVEHIDMSHVGDLTKEWYRVLAPGGVLAVCVPHAREIAQRWLAGQIDDFTYNVNMYGAYQGYPEDLHRWSYHPEYLKSQMSQGITWGRVQTLYPHMVQNDPRYHGASIAFDWWILAMEFTK